MEFWFNKYQLPVPPSDFEVTTGNQNEKVNITNIGEINLIGKKSLDSVTISSFFPAQEYSFCQYNGFLKPYEFVELFEKWEKDNDNKPIRVILTETNFNKPMVIDSFSYGQKDSTGDVYFTVELSEYIFVNVGQTVSSQSGSNTGGTNYTQSDRTVERQVTKEYVVKSGDTLWAIAKRATGDGANWNKIASGNGVKDPKALQVGQVLKI